MPLTPRNSATCPGVNASPAGMTAGALPLRRAFIHSVTFAASASARNTNPHPANTAVSRWRVSVTWSAVSPFAVSAAA